ncbi:MAG: acetate/propionate family kinase, partial [Candidatus Latescibacteria bacterium]|nr:acetate/propionate family kinase [Candidatus Latescibacterota bacterium]
LALDVLATSARDWLGAFVIEMGGLDAISFTGGIGEHSLVVRAAILRDLEFLGVEVDAGKNEAVRGEGTLHAAASRVPIHVLRTDEELVVARQTCEFLAL